MPDGASVGIVGGLTTAGALVVVRLSVDGTIEGVTVGMLSGCIFSVATMHACEIEK